MVRMNADHAARLWLVIQLQTRLERPADGWVKPRRQLLDQIELPRSIRDVIRSEDFILGPPLAAMTLFDTGPDWRTAFDEYAHADW